MNNNHYNNYNIDYEQFFFEKNLKCMSCKGSTKLFINKYKQLKKYKFYHFYPDKMFHKGNVLLDIFFIRKQPNLYNIIIKYCYILSWQMDRQFDIIPNLYKLIKIFWNNFLLDWQEWFLKIIKWRNCVNFDERNHFFIERSLHTCDLINFNDLMPNDRQRYKEINELTNFDHFLVIENSTFCNIDCFTNTICQDFLQDDNIYHKKTKYWKLGIWLDNKNSIIIFTIIQMNNKNPLKLEGFLINRDNIPFIVKKLLQMINLSLLQYWQFKFY